MPAFTKESMRVVKPKPSSPSGAGSAMVETGGAFSAHYGRDPFFIVGF
jgi:hypothetical protein